MTVFSMLKEFKITSVIKGLNQAFKAKYYQSIILVVNIISKSLASVHLVDSRFRSGF
jgi:hypothetical protein